LWESNDYLDSDFSGDVINASLSHYVDLAGKHVLAFNTQGAYGFESPEPFELGSSASSLAQPLFGRDSWSLRGYGEAVQQGNRVQTNTLEYRLPIATVERNWDLFPLGLGNISATLFADHGAAWQDDETADYLTGIGVELNTEVIIAYGMILPLKLGYAKGLDKQEGGERTYLSAGFAF
jgi:hemolysin activation/secretion protein